MFDGALLSARGKPGRRRSGRGGTGRRETGVTRLLEGLLGFAYEQDETSVPKRYLIGGVSRKGSKSAYSGIGPRRSARATDRDASAC